MKRSFYVSCFTILGILLGFLLHAVFEIYYIKLLVSDFNRYSLGFNYRQLLVVHGIFATVLFLAGAIWGYKQGKKWWQVIYIEQKYGKPRF